MRACKTQARGTCGWEGDNRTGQMKEDKLVRHSLVGEGEEQKKSHGLAGLAGPKLAQAGRSWLSGSRLKIAAQPPWLGSASTVANSGSGFSRKLAGAAETLPG